MVDKHPVVSIDNCNIKDNIKIHNDRRNRGKLRRPPSVITDMKVVCHLTALEHSRSTCYILDVSYHAICRITLYECMRKLMTIL